MTSKLDRNTAKYDTGCIVDGVLTAHPAPFARRAPGNACPAAVGSGRMGTLREPVNGSKGCSGVMRIAPVGLFFEPGSAFEPAEVIEEMAQDLFEHAIHRVKSGKSG
jgi:ADP-ribosylglycohydrolase